MSLSFWTPIRPLYVWGGYLGLCFFLAFVAAGQSWVSTVVMIYFVWAVFETIRYRRKAKKIKSDMDTSTRDRTPLRTDEPARHTLSPTRDVENMDHVLWSGERRIRFAYRSGDGSDTTREVTVYQVKSVGSGWNDDLYFSGLCHLRDEERMFRLDRVRYRNKVEDVDTGTIGTLRQIFSITERLER